MEQAELDTSKLPSFPPYRRSHLRSETYLTLTRIFSHLPATPDNGNGRKKPEKKEKGPGFPESVGSDFIHPKNAVLIKSIQEFDETVEGTGNKGRVCVVNDIVLGDIEEMMGIEEVEDTSRTLLQDRCNDADKEQQRIMDELELVVNGTQNIICDSGLISLSAVSGEEQNGSNAAEMQVQGSTDSLPNSKEAEVEKVELDYEDERLLDYDNLEDKCKMKNERNLEKSTCVNNASISSNIQIENEDIEEGELVGDLGVDCNSFDMPTADSFIPQTNIDEVQNPESINMGNTEKEGLGKEIGSKLVTDVPINYVQNPVLHKSILEEDSDQDHGNPAASEMVDVSCKKKRGPGSVEKKAKKKRKERKKRAKKNKQLGVKRLKLSLVQQKPKTISYCRHFLVGRCYEGDKCHFSHDTVPSTKSKPCSFFARHSCMKGDDCPFDHQLSKYPCVNFVSGGFCVRGDACLFSHQSPAKEDFAPASSVHNPGMKSPHFSGNTNSNMPPNIHGSSSIQQNHLINPPRVHSDINSEHKATNTVHKQLKLASKGVSFVDVAKLSLPSPTTPKEGTTKIGSSSSDQRTSGTNQTLVEIPKKLPARIPKGIKFLAFEKDAVCSFKSSVNSLVIGENSIDFLQNISFSLLDHTSSSLKDATKGRVPPTDLVSSEISGKNQSVAESIKLSFPGKASMNDASTGLQGSSHVDDNGSKPVQEASGASDSFQISTATPSPFMRLVSPSSSEQLLSRKELLSTVLSFAAEHESVIKVKDSAGTSTA
ncbi:zinc finger CCCH domain-containing protein 65 isoform X1 [Arachis stenosperma]|uniref:zinc finger CCCH domain-containing protein 65 isoform X1 n=1 Tax=Arachis stenosperma TaxID=217475 RepID=UPI0025AD76F1|nr:zinc finger CCCH domain-containing protein 65 isoform X1 [Arachis stenosperma]XP_057736559.1 zinc finger CCCH domain-containing protein 65 isoform X1 [Arachis stenosperma]XP_057736560.1 zinc finger CCCH domain-containing protein 65 isoform X1 [Arachis stenosperma]XP_057736561.1 zinc finger CCCH domain-containing protein 65 isoform X1 [Arachis stenosperma]